MPNRPDWNATDWKNYFKGNHPNFWFKEKLRKESIAKREKDKLVEFLQKQEKQKNQTEEKSSENTRGTDEQQKSPITETFFKDPLKPQPEEWLSWPPEKWIKWSKSDEYAELYANTQNIYRPSGVEQPESLPVLGYREKMPVLLTQWSTPTPKPTKTPAERSDFQEAVFVRKGEVAPPPETFFPEPTQSPTEDPNYLYNDDFKRVSSSQSRSQLSDIKPEFVINQRNNKPSVSSDYIYNKGVDSSGLPSSEFYQLSNLKYENYKDRSSGAINPSLLLLTNKPSFTKSEGLPAAEIDQSIYPFQTSFQEGLSPNKFENFDQNQGSIPAQGSIQEPQSRPPPSNTRQQQNRFRPPQFRPSRPGQQNFQPNNQQSDRRRNPNLPDNSNLSPDVFLPPVNENNPNFQNIYQNPGPPVNPYFPPNNPNYFPNQYPPPQPASSSTSTSSGGGSSSAAASSSAGYSSSSSTSVSEGGTNSNDNIYSECTGSQCSEENIQDEPSPDPNDNRNVFFSNGAPQRPIRTTETPNFLENLTFPNRGQQINLNIPPGVSPPPDLQEAINRGGPINLNCDTVNGCPTLIPSGDTSTTTSPHRGQQLNIGNIPINLDCDNIICPNQSGDISPTTTAAPAPAFSISISPIFGNINQGNDEEISSLGTSTTSLDNKVRDKLIENAKEISGEVDEIQELPQRGLGDDYINEIYELDSPINNNRVASINGINSKNDFVTDDRRVEYNNERVAEIPTVESSVEKDSSTSEDLKNIVEALSGLIQLLNSTGRRKNSAQNLKNVNLTQPFGFGHLGGKRYPVKNIIFDDEATFSKIKSQNLPDGDIIYFNVKKNLPSPQLQSFYSPSVTDTTTIPPHLIPLGPDGSPLVKADGTYIQHGRSGQNSHLSQMFPYLANTESYTTTITTTTASTPENITSTPPVPVSATNTSDVDNRDMITRTMDMIHDMPMDTKRHMLANMMVGVPMAAITMAAVGLPPLGIF